MSDIETGFNLGFRTAGLSRFMSIAANCTNDSFKEWISNQYLQYP